MSSHKKNNTDNKIKIVFMGTPDFAVPGLESLINNSNFEIIAVFTKTDQPVGRKLKVTSPPIKDVAIKYNIPVFQPEKIKNEFETINKLQPDLIVVIAYGKIIPPEILTIPKYGCINVHASLLPKYRGSACLNAPILNGDTETGVTIMLMEAGLDTGPILKQEKIDLLGKETLEDLHDKLSLLGASLLPQTLISYVKNEIIPQKQDDSKASYVKMLDKKDGRIIWQDPAIKIERMIRAYNPWPGTYSQDKNGKMIKIIKAEFLLDSQQKAENTRKPGELILKDKQLLARCGQDYLVILELQIEGGRALKTADFLSGHPDFIKQVLE